MGALIERLQREAERDAARGRSSTRRYVETQLHQESRDQSNSSSSRIRALELLGKAAGMWHESVQVAVTDGILPKSEADTLAEIEQLLERLGPGAAASSPPPLPEES